jgi:hypothetical protein
VKCANINEVIDYLHTMGKSLEYQMEQPLTIFSCVTKASKLKPEIHLSVIDRENFEVFYYDHFFLNFFIVIKYFIFYFIFF